MSYILDALRRADAERERGAVPGIHAQRFAQEGDEELDAEPRRRGRPGRWLAGGAALALLLGAGAWYYLLGAGVPAEVERLASAPAAGGTVAGAPAAPAAPAAAPPAATAPTAAPPAVAPAPAPSPAAAPAPAPRAEAAPARPSRRATPPPRPESQEALAAPRVPAEAPRARAAARPGGAADAPPGRPARPAAAATDAAADALPAPPPPAVEQPRVYAQNELPPEIRRQLPKLTIGGSIYSEDRANRFLIINGQVFHEGSQPAPGLVLEQIRLKSAVLGFKGYRYSISY